MLARPGPAFYREPVEEKGGAHADLAAELTRRGFLARAGTLSAGALVVAAIPVAHDLFTPADAAAQDPALADATLQAFADTMIPGRAASTTDLGAPIHPQAIAGVDPEPGAVQADALALYHHPNVGFDALEGAFLADLERRALPRGGPFLTLGFEARVAVCLDGLSFENPARVIWEVAAAVPFTAFCAAALVPEQTAERASGYRVMGLPGRAPRGYASFSYRRRLARERTRRGSMP